MSFSTISNHVAFEFEDEVHDGQFSEQFIGSIMIANKGKNYENDGKLNRIAKVIDIGPQCRDVKVGDRVVVEKQCWTPGFVVDDKTIWRTTEKHILAIIDD